MAIKKFAQIDSLRFFAVFSVVCVHWHWFGSNFSDLITSGSRGVDLFFVISGFLITLGLIRAKESIATNGNILYKFYIKRSLRIFPIYYLTVFILLFFYWDKMWPAIWWYILYLRNFYSIKIQDWGVAGHFWSLSVEEQFYLVWPFIILLVPVRRLLLAVISAIVLSISFKLYWWFHNYPFWYSYMHPIGALDTLALGALLAYLYYYHTETLRKVLYNPYFSFVIFLQMIFFISIRLSPHFNFLHHIFIRTFFGMFCMWLIGRATFGFSGIAGYVLDSKPLQYIGKISYSIYLFHIFIPGMLSGIPQPANENWRFLIYAICTITISSISWYFFESPILKLKERFE